jgi:FKBP-type peptidyl-prolyl cis-trans isomerase FkpA
MIKKFSKSVFFFLTISLIVILVSCDPSKKYEKAEKDAINNYLAANSSSNYVHQESGLYYLEVLAGTGRQPVANDTVYVVYTGKFLNGNMFDTNVGGNQLVFAVGQGGMLPGFEEGIMLMKEGGKATILVPSNLAYGTQGYYTIPGYTALLFDIELAKVVPGPSSSKK